VSSNDKTRQWPSFELPNLHGYDQVAGGCDAFSRLMVVSSAAMFCLYELSMQSMMVTKAGSTLLTRERR
jgi:hypothetical protein